MVYAHTSHNIPAVCDVFAVAIEEREAFQQPQKCGGEKTAQRALARLRFIRSPSRRKAAKRIQSCYTMIFLPHLITAVVHGRTTAWIEFFSILFIPYFF
jgi:hypothetical protein